MSARERLRGVVLLLEGSTEEIVYSILLEKLYRAKRVACTSLPRPLAEALAPLMPRPLRSVGGRLACYKLESGGYITLINCGGYDNVVLVLRELLGRRHRELARAAVELALSIVVAADSDRDPLQGIKGVLASLGLKAREDGGIHVGLPNNAELAVYVIEQGGRGEGLTGEIEDDLSSFMESLDPELREAVEKIEEARGRLDSKQKLLIYLALRQARPKARSLLHGILRETLENSGHGELRRGFKGIVDVLDYILEA